MPTDKNLNRLRINKTESMFTLIGVPDVPGSARMIFNSLAKSDIPITMIVQNAPDTGYANITFAVNRKDAGAALEITRQMVGELGADGLMSDDKIVRLSVVGKEVLEHAVGVAGEFFSILADEGINVLAINTTADIISCIIEDACLEEASKLLCDQFGLDIERIE